MVEDGVKYNFFFFFLNVQPVHFFFFMVFVRCISGLCAVAVWGSSYPMGRRDPVTEARHLPGADAHEMITAGEARRPGAGSPAPLHTHVLFVLTLSEMANGSFFLDLSPPSV